MTIEVTELSPVRYMPISFKNNEKVQNMQFFV